MKKFALLILVVLALGASSAAFGATVTIGGTEYAFETGNSGPGWEVSGGQLRLSSEYNGGSIAFKGHTSTTHLIYTGDVTVKGSISTTGPIMIEDQTFYGEDATPRTLTVDYTGGTKYALEGGADMHIFSGRVKLIAPAGKFYDVKPTIEVSPLDVVMGELIEEIAGPAPVEDNGLGKPEVESDFPDEVVSADIASGATIAASYDLTGQTDANGVALATAFANKNDVDNDTIIGLPVFEATIPSGKTLLMSYSVASLDILADKGYTVDDVVMVKLVADGEPIEFTRIARPAAVRGGEFAITKSADVTAELAADAPIENNVAYTFTFAISDDSAYDWNKTPGTVVDPAAIAAKASSTPSSSSGCSATGPGLGALILAALALAKRRASTAK